ncbi:uncharacterized protein LOC113290633 [Papaver somniferum]|uniref:uncharacterized protein LOC113290633 n=1 Tax=Papaver somniferum TaxID=3469 RepID=UPI000E6F4A56|nr:uncharacterized protein LOC113290633 [Papaver somniferum]
MCSVCQIEEETLEHVLWSCSFAKKAWRWISGIFNMMPHYNILAYNKAAKGRSRMFKDLWLVANLVVRSKLWFTRNKKVYEKKSPCWSVFQKRVFHLMHEYSVRMKGFMHNTVADLRVMNYFWVNFRRVKQYDPIQCCWFPPNQWEMLLCCDKASKNNPGVAGAEVVARDTSCGVVGAMEIGMGITSKFLAEVYGIVVGLEWAVQWGFRKILIRSDSSSVINILEKNTFLWFVQQRWEDVCARYDSIRFVHSFREAIFAADKMARRGCNSGNGAGMHYVDRPDFLRSIELPNVAYFRFK